MLNGEPFNVYFEDENSADSTVKKMEKRIAERKILDEVAPNKGKGNTGTGNTGENASVGRPGKSASSGSKKDGPRQSDGSRGKSGGTGAEHTELSNTNLDGKSNPRPSESKQEQEDVFNPLPEDVELLDRGQSGRTKSNGTNRPANSNQSSDTRYVPRVTVTNTAHRGNVTEAPNMRFVSLPDEIFEGDTYLPHPKVIKGGKYKLSDVQIETIMAAKYNFEMGKPGMLIADDTGMGKTAQQLGIAADAFYSGRTKRILIVTTKDQVATVNFPRDNKMLGLDLPITWMHKDNKQYTKQHGYNWKDYHFNGKPTKKGGKPPAEYKPFQVGDGVIIMSKDTFRDAKESVIKWLEGAEGDVTIIIDESHEFANGEAGRGKANKLIYNHFKDKAQWIYASATAAENIDGLEHMYGLQKWSTDGFGTFKLRLTSADVKATAGKKQTGMSASFAKNGNSPFQREIPLTMMEQITRELKLDGQYLGRALSMEGVSMDGLPIKISPEEEGDWNRAVQFIRMIAEKAEMYGRKKNGDLNPKQRGQIASQVVGYMRRISGYYRMKAVIEDIKEQMKSGEFERFGIIGEFVKGDDGRPANLFAAINVINTQDPIDTGDDVVYEDIPEAIADKEYLLAILRGENPEWGEYPVPIIPTPMSLLYDAFGEENVAIVSGEVDGKDRPKVVEEFQNMKKQIIWFNSAGGTGVDMHDTVGTPIRVYTQDYAYTAKAQKQAEGRFHRTGQVTAPTFVYPYLNSSTDTKFVGTLIARYEAMGALSRGDVGKLGGESLSDFDMTGEAAEIASVRIIPELDEEVRVQMFGEFTRDTNFISDFNGGLDETAAASVYSGNEPEVKKFLNALMFLDYKASSRVFAQFTEKIKEVEKELAEKGGVKDKFETYKGKELEVQVGKTGIKLRKIKTILTDAQKRKLDYDLEMAVKNEAAMEEEYIKTEQETLSKYEKQVDEINAKQIETKLREDEAREAYRKLRSDLTAKPEDVGKAYNKYNAIVNEFNRRKERLDEVKTKLKGLKDGNEDVILTIADMKRAQTRKKNAKLTRMGAQANIERSQDILLIDGKIATNGLLVNIRQAIREAARRVYGEKNTPASALTLELRGYVLENGEKALGAVVPKWAEAEVAKSLEARMSYQGNANDLEELKAFVEAGNKVSLQGGYELEYKSGPAKIIINGMTVAKDKDLFKSINDGEKHLGFHPVARAFSVDTTEGMKRLLERFPIMEKKVSKENQPEQPKSPTPPGTRKVLGYAVEVKTDKHTQTGEDIWLIKPIDNVPKEKWAQLAGHMKKHGGSYYGKFTKGPLRQFMGNFVFQKNPADVFDTESTPSNAEEVNTFIPSRNSSSAAPSSTEETVTRAQIINHVRKEFNVPIGTGRYRNRAKGLYKKVVNEIRMKNFADFVVLAHELGHQLDNKFKLVQDHNRDELIDLAMSNLMIPNRMSEEEVAAEGVAEFVRLYLYNRPAIMGMDFYREFSERMEEEGKLEALETLTTMLDTWTGQSAEARVDGVTDVRQKRKKMKNPKQKAKDLYADWVEELIGLKRATDKLKGNRTLEGREDPYMLAWRTRGTSGKIQAFLEHGIIDEETGTKIAPSFKEIIESVPEIQKLRRYLEAKHALTLHGEGKYKTPITETDANGIISRLDGESSTYSEAAENLYEYQDYVTRELVASGILKENTVDEWNDKYPFYVPFYRVMEEAGEREGESKGNGSRRHQFANSANPVKKMKDTGSAKNLVDPLESIMKNTFMYLNLAQRNDVGTALTDLLGEDSAEVMVEVDPKQYATLFNLDEVKKDILTVLNDSGMSLTNDDIDFDKMSKVFRPFIAPSMTENIVTVWKNGERKMYEVRDEELYRALTAMDNETIWEWIKLMAIPNNILRTGITLSPTFIPRGPIRSVMTLMQQSSSYTTPMDYMRLFPDLFMGAVSSVKKDDSFWDWMSAGGAQSTLLSIEREYFKDAKNRILFKPATKEVLKQAVLSVGTVPIYKGLRYVSQMFDEAVRIAEYKQARRKGADRVEAAIRSRDVDADFSKFGRSSKNINRMDLFFNIAIQGPDRFIREMKAHPVRSLVRGFSLITLPTMALMALNYDDENYWELEQWERDLFWNIPIGDGKFFKIPIPFEWGFAFKAIPERLVQGWARDDRTAFEGFFKSMAMSMLPTIVPTLFIPWIEFMAEKDWGTWRSTTRPYDNRPAEEQTNDHTTEMAKWLGGLIDQPPTKIDQFANSFAGTFGSMAMTGAGLFIPNEYGEKPSSDKGFFERSFIADSADGNTFSTTKFYDNKDKMEKEHSENGVKGEPNDDLRIARDAETYLSQLRKLRTLVRTDKTKSGTEKGDHITKINSAIRDISRLALGKEPFDSENMKFYANYARENKDFEHEE